MDLSARNPWSGTVGRGQPGAVNAELEIELPGGAKLVSVITCSSAEALGPAVGGNVPAAVQASNVMIGVE
jgi:molybdate transport system regulatory protein